MASTPTVVTAKVTGVSSTPAQSAHVLLAVHAVNHSAGGQESSALKNACVIRWKIAAE